MDWLSTKPTLNKWGRSLITGSGPQLSNHTSCDQSCFSKKYLWAREQESTALCVCVWSQSNRSLSLKFRKMHWNQQSSSHSLWTVSNSEHKNTFTSKHTAQRDHCILMPTTAAKYSLTDVIFAKSFIPVDKQGLRTGRPVPSAEQHSNCPQKSIHPTNSVEICSFTWFHVLCSSRDYDRITLYTQ